MLKYYLDKTGKVIKSILFPSSEFVDTEPRKGSMNPVTSGGVADAVEEGAGAAASNLAPEYSATSTYPEGSYVIHDGVLYTNPSAIGTAEDWNPAHWTQTTVAEMMAGAGGGYKEVTLPPIVSEPYNIPVGNREIVTVSYIGASDTDAIQLQLADDCVDAIVFFANKRPVDIAFHKLKITRQDINDVPLFGKNYLYDVHIHGTYDYNTLISDVIDGSGAYGIPTDWSEVAVTHRVSDVDITKAKATESSDTGFLIEIKGNVAILHIH